jgi:hypothetical protein
MAVCPLDTVVSRARHTLLQITAGKTMNESGRRIGHQRVEWLFLTIFLDEGSPSVRPAIALGGGGNTHTH